MAPPIGRRRKNSGPASSPSPSPSPSRASPSSSPLPAAIPGLAIGFFAAVAAGFAVSRSRSRRRKALFPRDRSQEQQDSIAFPPPPAAAASICETLLEEPRDNQDLQSRETQLLHRFDSAKLSECDDEAAEVRTDVAVKLATNPSVNITATLKGPVALTIEVKSSVEVEEEECEEFSQKEGEVDDMMKGSSPVLINGRVLGVGSKQGIDSEEDASSGGHCMSDGSSEGSLQEIASTPVKPSDLEEGKAEMIENPMPSDEVAVHGSPKEEITLKVKLSEAELRANRGESQGPLSAPVSKPLQPAQRAISEEEKGILLETMKLEPSALKLKAEQADIASELMPPELASHACCLVERQSKRAGKKLDGREIESLDEEWSGALLGPSVVLSNLEGNHFLHSVPLKPPFSEKQPWAEEQLVGKVMVETSKHGVDDGKTIESIIGMNQRNVTGNETVPQPNNSVEGSMHPSEQNTALEGKIPEVLESGYPANSEPEKPFNEEALQEDTIDREIHGNSREERSSDTGFQNPAALLDGVHAPDGEEEDMQPDLDRLSSSAVTVFGADRDMQIMRVSEENSADSEEITVSEEVATSNSSVEAHSDNGASFKQHKPVAEEKSIYIEDATAHHRLSSSEDTEKNLLAAMVAVEEHYKPSGNVLDVKSQPDDARSSFTPEGEACAKDKSSKSKADMPHATHTEIGAPKSHAGQDHRNLNGQSITFSSVHLLNAAIGTEKQSWQTRGLKTNLDFQEQLDKGQSKMAALFLPAHYVPIGLLILVLSSLLWFLNVYQATEATA